MMPDDKRDRDVRGALYGSRLVDLPHVKPKVDACLDFIAGSPPVLVEVGFDHGRRLHATARENPQWRIVGLEVRARRVEQARARAQRDGLSNVLVWRMDAKTVFARVLKPASVDVVEILFPTPWWHPGLRRKRLLFDAAFTADVARALKPGGLLCSATDVAEVERGLVGVLETSDRFSSLSTEEGYAMRPPCSQLSRRQWSCERAGTRWNAFFWRRR